MAILSIDKICLNFNGLKAVDEVSFSVDQGTVLGLIGPNGAGKTSVLNMISGLYRTDSGRINLGEVAIHGLPPHRVASAGVQRTFQNIRLFQHLTVLENVLVGFLPNRHGTMRAGKEAALSVLRDVGLVDLAGVLPSELPYAFQRRVEIARALVANPKVLLLDEPAAGMHADERKDLVNLIRKLAAEGLTILVIEHDMPMISEICDEIVVMNFGKTIARGTIEDIRNDPTVQTAYLGVM